MVNTGSTVIALRTKTSQDKSSRPDITTTNKQKETKAHKFVVLTPITPHFTPESCMVRYVTKTY